MVLVQDDRLCPDRFGRNTDHQEPSPDILIGPSPSFELLIISIDLVEVFPSYRIVQAHIGGASAFPEGSVEQIL